jgi:hypothetical protein
LPDLQIEFLEFFQFTYHLLSKAGRSDAAVAEQEKAKNALKRPIRLGVDILKQVEKLRTGLSEIP